MEVALGKDEEAAAVLSSDAAIRRWLVHCVPPSTPLAAAAQAGDRGALED